MFCCGYLLEFLNPLLELGYQRPLTQVDLGKLKESIQTENLYKIFAVQWKGERAMPKGKQSIWRALLKTIGYKRQLFGLILSGISAGCAFGPPLILRSLVNYFGGVTYYPKSTLWIFVVLLFCIPVFGGICLANSYVIYIDTAIGVRSILTAAIYRKTLVIGNSSKKDFSSGQIMNLFSVDCANVQMFFLQFAAELFAPFQLAVALGLVYREVGVAMFAGFGFVFVILPLLLVAFVAYAKLRASKYVPGDARIKLTNEILSGIRIIKYYAWEVPFTKKIYDIRKLELGFLFQMNMALVLIVMLITAIPFVMPIIIFYTYTKIGNQQLDISTAFTTLALLGLVTTPVMMIPGFIQRFFQAMVSGNRILKFLVSDDLIEYVQLIPSADEHGDMITLDHASFAWLTEDIATDSNALDAQAKVEAIVVGERKGSEGAEKSVELVAIKSVYAAVATTEEDVVKETAPGQSPVNRGLVTLIDMDLHVKKGELIAIVGGVGSGKTSLLSAILGEIQLKQGAVIRGSERMAYHAQQAWILNATVKDNILLGLPYDEAQLNRAIDAACLTADIAILPAGLETEIGEKGINLSGGQKARVSFARAVYRNADIYLLGII